MCHQEESFSERSVYLVAKQVATGLVRVLQQCKHMQVVLYKCYVIYNTVIYTVVSMLQDYLLSEHRLVHGNIAACNMLIGSGLLVKVSGLALAFESRQTETETVGKERTADRVPLKWQAPERLLRFPVTSRSDV